MQNVYKHSPIMNHPTLDFDSILKEICPQNIEEKLNLLETVCSARKIKYGANMPLLDLLYISQHEILLVKCDTFFTSDKDQDWLADEEACDGEVPLYFSQGSHRVSPLYRLHKVKEFYSRFFPAPQFKIHLLLICNHTIVNYDDMKSIWEEMDATVIHQVNKAVTDSVKAYTPKSPSTSESNADTENDTHITDDEMIRLLEKFIDTNANIPQEEIKFPRPDDLPNNDNKTEPYDDEEFSRLLDEFIVSQEENPEKVEPENYPIPAEEKENNEDESNEDEEFTLPIPDCFAINTVNLYGKWGEKEARNKPVKKLSIKALESIHFHILLRSWLSKIYKGVFCISLYNDSGTLLHTEKRNGVYTLNKKYSDVYDVTLELTIEQGDKFTWSKGIYLIEVQSNKETIGFFLFEISDKTVYGSILSDACSTDTDDDAFAKINRMTGLSSLKEQMENLRTRVLLAQKRKQKNLESPIPSLHTVFMGNPGTGKTTIARLYGKMLKELGLLSKGHVVFQKRSTLMGQNYASEQEKTLAVIEEAKGGILFIDDANILYKSDDSKDPGRNIIETLLSELGGEKDKDWGLLLSGPTEEMTAFLSSHSAISSHFPIENRFIFEDYNVDELMSIAETFCEKNNYFLSSEAKTILRNKVQNDYNKRDLSFGNGRYIINLLSNEILKAMSLRIGKIKNPSLIQLMKIEKEDIPVITPAENPMLKLHSMIGLNKLKTEMEKHLNMVKMMKKRNELGIISNLPPLHMAFLGNPGTGKTTVAQLIGEIYASMGILSTGRVITAERKDLIGRYIGDTEHKMSELLKKAKGNVLFIDEAYSLYDDNNKSDFGQRAMEALLTTLSKDYIDMIIIFAGYPEEMKKLFSSNPGLESRIPYTFYFDDYTLDELMEIGKKIAKEKEFRFTPTAWKALKDLVKKNMENSSQNWGNARFISRLITNEIIPAMGTRIQALPAEKQNNVKVLTTICKSDIPSYDRQSDNEYPRIRFDEIAIKKALKELDGMVGLEQVKKNVHDFVRVSRLLQKSSKIYSESFPLRWNFIGNTGTGKSTVASIMGRLLKALNILDRGHLTEIKFEEFYNVSEYKADTFLKSAIKKSREGILFIDGDASLFKQADCKFSSDEIQFKLNYMLEEIPGNYAIILSENETNTDSLTKSLHRTGFPMFNHTFYFKDYTEEQLLPILEKCLDKHNLSLSAEASDHIGLFIRGLCSRRDLGYANARTMKIIAESIAEIHWTRLGEKGSTIKRSQIPIDEIKAFVWDNLDMGKRVGFKNS